MTDDAAEKGVALENAHAALQTVAHMPGVLTDATPAQKAAADVRLPTRQERAAALAAWATVLHKRNDDGGAAAHEVRPVLPLDSKPSAPHQQHT